MIFLCCTSDAYKAVLLLVPKKSASVLLVYYSDVFRYSFRQASIMVKKRGNDRIEKVVRKRPQVHASETSDEMSQKKARNILNDRILNLYKREASLNGESSVFNSPRTNEAEVVTNDERKESAKNIHVTPSLQSTKSGRIGKKNPGFSVNFPSITFKDVAGLDDTFQEILQIFFRLRDPEVFSALNAKKGKYILLHGPAGCGKTLLAQAIAGETGLPLLEVAITELVCSASGESESKIREIFEEALRTAPCILFIDRIDVIAPKIDSSDSRGMEKRMATQLLASLDALKKKDNSENVMVIAATNRPDSMDPGVISRFYYEFPVTIPNEKARLMILQVLTKHLNLSADFNMEWLAHNTPGYVGADLHRLVERAFDITVNRLYHKFINKNLENESGDSNSNLSFQHDSKPNANTVISFYKSTLKMSAEEVQNTTFELQSFKDALKDITPSSKREGFCMVPNVSWEDVGALKDIKEELQETIIWPVKYRKLYENCNMKNAVGILLYGPKGCGKTLLAKVIANECSINFLSVKGPELLNMYLGESERAVRQCFQRARNSAPCVIFFDEMDALCPERTGTNSNAAAERVVNMLLTEMDGMEERNQVFVIGATNRLEKIDSAMLRPGRLEKIIYVGVPSPDDRVDILKSLTKNKTLPKIADDVELEAIGHDSRCENFSGADLAHLIRAATANAIKEHIKASSTSALNDDTVEVHLRHFEHAFSKVKPSVSEKDKKYFQRISEQRR